MLLIILSPEMIFERNKIKIIETTVFITKYNIRNSRKPITKQCNIILGIVRGINLTFQDILEVHVHRKKDIKTGTRYLSVSFNQYLNQYFVTDTCNSHFEMSVVTDIEKY